MLGQERTVLPLLADQEFGMRAYTTGLSFILAFGLTKAAANYFAGTWSDRYGPKPVLVAGWLVAVPIPLLLIWASSWGWVLVANAVLRVSQGLSWSTTVVMKIDLVGPSCRGLAMGLNEAAGYAAVAVSAPTTGYLAESHGLRPATSEGHAHRRRTPLCWTQLGCQMLGRSWADINCRRVQRWVAARGRGDRPKEPWSLSLFRPSEPVRAVARTGRPHTVTPANQRKWPARAHRIRRRGRGVGHALPSTSNAGRMALSGYGRWGPSDRAVLVGPKHPRREGRLIKLTRQQLLRARDDGSDALLPLPAISDHLGVSVRTVCSWVLAGELPVVRVAGRWHALLSHASELQHEGRPRTGPPRP